MAGAVNILLHREAGELAAKLTEGARHVYAPCTLRVPLPRFAVEDRGA
jgi:hypothetical protein